MTLSGDRNRLPDKGSDMSVTLPTRQNTSLAVRSDIARIIGTGTALAFCLMILRAAMLGDSLGADGILSALGQFLDASSQDFLLSILLTAVFLALAQILRAGSNVIAVIYFVVALFCVLWGVVNIEIVKMLGEPLTLTWLSYSDVFKSADFKVVKGITDSLTVFAVSVLVLSAAGFSLASSMFRRAIGKIGPIRLLVVCALLASTCILALFSRNSPDRDPQTLNPVVAFVQSVISNGREIADEQPSLVSDIEGMGPNTEHQYLLPPLSDSQRRNIRNIVVFVLESAGAEYIQNYGGKYPVTPNLLNYASRSHKFENIYTHTPTTPYALFSLLTSLYSDGTSSMTRRYGNYSGRTIANHLAEKGYRTGLFNSSDTRFQAINQFLVGRGFDVVQDARSRPCDTALYRYSNDDSQILDLSNDLCTVKSLTDWLDKEPGKPFFSLMWTGMSHYPYFAGGKEWAYDPSPSRNRFLNALRIGDEAFGVLMKHLEARGLADSTLVVVLGDHGEAFGQHRTFGHASGLYEENLHIPLLLINAPLFAGSTSKVVGGIHDIGPTVLDILGLPAPSRWQGYSLFAPQRPRRVFFFSPWNGFQIGYREGANKFIYRREREKVEWYDLSIDPQENTNLAAQWPASTDPAKAILNAWLQSQSEKFDSFFAPPKTDESDVATNEGKTSSKLTFLASGTKHLTPPTAQLLVDDKFVETFTVNAAPSNTEREAHDDEIEAAYTPFEFSIGQDQCPRKIEIRFVNDEWAGEGKTGDTNLFVKDIRVNGLGLAREKIHIESQKMGVVGAGSVWFWQNGGATMDLDSETFCKL